MAIVLTFTKPSRPPMSGAVRRDDQLLAQVNPMGVNASAEITVQTPIVKFTGFAGAKAQVAPAPDSSTGCLKVNTQEAVVVDGRCSVYDWAIFGCDTSGQSQNDPVYIDGTVDGGLDFSGTKRVGEVLHVATAEEGGKILVSPANY